MAYPSKINKEKAKRWLLDAKWVESKRFALWGTVCLMMIGLIIRILYIGEESLYLDEVFSVFYSQQRLPLLLEAVGKDSNPPLHFVLLKYWMEMTNNSVNSVRLLSSVFNVATIPIVMLIGRKYFNSLTGWVASILFTFSNVYIVYSQEARCYALVSFLVALSLLLHFSFSKKGSWSMAILIGSVNGLLLLTHYGTYLWLLIQVPVFIVLNGTEWKHWKRIIAGSLATLVLFLPWMLYFLTKFKKPSTWAEPPDLYYLDWVLLVFAGKRWLEILFAFIILTSTPFLVLRFYKDAGNWQWKKYIVLLCAGPLAIAAGFVLSNFTVPIFKPNYLLFSLIGVFLLIGYGFSAFPIPKSLAFLLTLVFLYLVPVWLQPHPLKTEQWKDAAAIVKREKTGRTLVLVQVYYQLPSFCYYYNPEYFRNYRSMEDKLAEENIHGITHGSEVEQFKKAEFEKVITVQSHWTVNDPQNDLGSALKESMKMVTYDSLGSIDIRIYKNPG